MSDNDKLTVIIEQFKALREELLFRNKLHAQLVLFKVVSLGGLLYFFCDKILLQPPNGSLSALQTSAQYFLWIVPLMASVFDMLIAGNLRAMYNVGPYLKAHIEPKFREHSQTDTKFWEETVASANPKYFCYTPIDLVTIWFFSFASLLLVIVVRSRMVFETIDYISVAVLAEMTVASLTYLIRSIKMKREF